MQSTPRTLYVVVNCNYIGNDRSCTRSHVDVTATETVSENGQNRFSQTAVNLISETK